MTDARPKLEVVPGGGGSAEPAPAPPAPWGGRRLIWLLRDPARAARLIGLGIESRRAAELLRAGSSASPPSSASHPGGPRGPIGATSTSVRASVAELQMLVERDPVASPSESP